LSIHSFRADDLWHLAWWKQFGFDVVVGSFILGPALALLFAVPTYWIALRRSREPERTALIEEAAYCYLGTGLFNWEFVRGKLRHDPVYFHLLRPGALPLPPGGRLLDLGCGRGIVFALLLAARNRAERGEYPAAWGEPPPALHFYGIETSPKAVDVACQALGADAHIEKDNLCTAPLPPADAVLLLDVLHYLPAAAQEDLLARIAASLSPGGLLLIRDADAGGGWRFTATRVQERLCALARRHWRQRFHYRSRGAWSRLLASLGFEVVDQPMGEGTPYANVLLTARKR
jgi:SAM-dependent methyltransferase